jgi:large subunit ribosomal protein L25
MTTQGQYVKLAQSLPPRLIRFFARYPPPALLQANKPFPIVTTQTSTTASTSPIPLSDTATTTEDAPPAYKNPFQAQRCPKTGKWHDPVFSLRRQAELVKLARKHGVEELLPFTVKGTDEKLKRREDRGLRVKGTGIGQKVKGKEWERTLKGR